MNIRLSLPIRLFIVLGFLLLPAHPARAAWVLDGNLVSAAIDNQYNPTLVSDGAGGAIITWVDWRGVVDGDIYAQRIDATGTPLWTTDGVAICAAAGNQYAPILVTDGAGGAIIVWYDFRASNYDVYARRVDASGAPLWTVNGVAVGSGTGNQLVASAVADGSGGAVIAWQDSRSGNYDIYAQRLDASGSAMWPANGVALCTAVNDQGPLASTTDGAGGAIFVWQDFRPGGTTDVYARRINSSGTPQWAADGVGICTETGNQYNAVITSNGTGGAIIAWQDERLGGSNADIYARLIDGAGNAQWTANGVGICVVNQSQAYPSIASDGAGGAIVAWGDYRSATEWDIYARRITGSGSPLWTNNGVPMCTVSGDQVVPIVLADGEGGVIAMWSDYRNGQQDVFAGRIDASGHDVWDSGGVGVRTATGPASYPQMAADGTGAVIMTWQDGRSGYLDIFAQRVEPRYGSWGRPEPILTQARDNPNDQGGKVILNWTASGRDVLNQQQIWSYSVWRAMDVVSAASTLSAKGVTILDQPLTLSVPSGDLVIWHELTPSTEYYWEKVGSQSAYYNVAYSFTAPTREDSTLGNMATQYFRVTAESYSQFYNWPSNVLSAHSVDNLAPAAPLFLAAQRVGADVHLNWNGVHLPDLKNYAVYRATSSGVTPVPLNFLANSNDSLLVDPSAPTSALFYIVTAKDVHENQSAPSNEASVSPLTGIGDTPSITVLTVLQNHPNPFTGSTELEIGLPAASDVAIEVYDVAGRRVRKQALSQRPAGWQRVAFSGRDDSGQLLASGVYFYRVTANGKTVTNKMVITR